MTRVPQGHRRNWASLKALTVEEGAGRFVLEVNPKPCRRYAKLRDEADAASKALEGVASVSLADRPFETGHRARFETGPQIRNPLGHEKIPGVDRIMPFASGKAASEKSTLLRNACLSLAARRPVRREACWTPMSFFYPGPVGSPGMLGVSGGLRRLMARHHCRCRQLGRTMMGRSGDDQLRSAVVWRGPMLMARCSR